MPTNITEVSEFPEDIPLIETGEPVRGGPTGADNRAAILLANRTRYLKDLVETLSAQGIKVVGTLTTEDELLEIDTNGMMVGTGYFVENHLRVWNGSGWADSGNLAGQRGITFLGVWPDNQQLPDPSLNEIGDAYVWQHDIFLLLPTPDNWVKIGIPGAEGKDVYEVAVEEGFTGTKTQFLTSLIGKDAFKIAQDNGYAGNQAQWLASLVGKSTYQIWLDRGGIGSEDAFLTAMKIKGDKGDKGNTGDQGIPALAFTVAGVKATVGALPRPGNAADAWFVGTTLYVWTNGDYLALPGMGGQSAYDLAVLGGYGGTQSQWIASLTGKSVYQTWVDAGGTGGTAAFLTAMKVKGDQGIQGIQGETGPSGKNLQVLGTVADQSGLAGKPLVDQAAYVTLDTGHLWVYVLASTGWVDLGKFRGADGTNGINGTNGLAGLSAYQVWLAAGNVGSQAQFLASLKGTNLVIKGAVATQSALPASPADQDAYGVRDTNTVQLWTNGQWNNLGAFKGEQGEEGPEGQAGHSFALLGSFANMGALQAAHPTGALGDAYLIGSNVAIWSTASGGSWIDGGPVRGPEGKSAYQLWKDAGNSGTEAQFLASLKGTDGENGEDGADGLNMVITDVVNTYSALPLAPADKSVYAVRDVNKLYARIGSSWKDMGTFKGTDGINGTNGTDGKDGQSVEIVKVLTVIDPNVPSVAGNNGKAYVDMDGNIYFCIAGSWVLGGKVGATGDKGEAGTGLSLRGTVATVTALPAKATAEDGDGWFTQDDKMLYVLTDGEWAGPFDINGMQGIQGEQGPEGQAGKSISILGAYATLGALAAAHPTGALGDGYLVGNNLAIWTTAGGGQWIDIGLIRGPQGIQGIPGPQGIQGVPGPRGLIGSRWLKLPVGVDVPEVGFTGNVGDWAVSETFKVYYKTADQGWIFWGELVAGDVNSPFLGQGKVVRYGTQWIPLPVDEVPLLVDGKLYVRQLVDGSDDNEGEWVELPNYVVDVPTDSNTYMRKGDHTWFQYTPPTLTSLGGVPTTALGDTVATLVAGKIPAGQLPSYVDDVLEFANQAAFPATGETGKIYISLATNAQFRWTGSVYIGLVASPGTTDAVAEGTTNLYHTPARVRAVTLAGVSFGTGGAITAADTVLTAFGKIQAQITAFVPGFADVPTDSNLYVRKGDKTWVVLPAQGIAAPANDGKQYVYKGTGWVSFDRYDVPILALSATGGIDPNVNLFARIDNSGATAKTITLADGPKGASARALVLVVKVNGAAGVITFAPTGATALVWNTGSPPALTGSRTYLTFTWDGVEWVGAAGAVVP